jgi:hypothetical protein
LFSSLSFRIEYTWPCWPIRFRGYVMEAAISHVADGNYLKYCQTPSFVFNKTWKIYCSLHSFNNIFGCKNEQRNYFDFLFLPKYNILFFINMISIKFDWSVKYARMQIAVSHVIATHWMYWTKILLFAMESQLVYIYYQQKC